MRNDEFRIPNPKLHIPQPTTGSAKQEESRV